MAEELTLGGEANLPPEARKHGWKEPGEKPNYEQKFFKELKIWEKKCTENKIPFCRPCARIDFERKIMEFIFKKRLNLENEKQDTTPLDTIAFEINFDKYAGDKCFDKPIESYKNEKQGLNIIRVEYADYVCKNHSNHHISVEKSRIIQR